jgi:FtsH-binding integral membrane protein
MGSPVFSTGNEQMTFGQIQVLCGFLGAGLVTLLTVIRQRKLALEDVGAALAAFLTASTLPVAVLLCLYGFDPDPPSVPTKLQGYEKYVASAGFVLFLTTTITLSTLVVKAFSLNQAVTTGASEVSPAIPDEQKIDVGSAQGSVDR